MEYLKAMCRVNNRKNNVITYWKQRQLLVWGRGMEGEYSSERLCMHTNNLVSYNSYSQQKIQRKNMTILRPLLQDRDRAPMASIVVPHGYSLLARIAKQSTCFSLARLI